LSAAASRLVPAAAAALAALAVTGSPACSTPTDADPFPGACPYFEVVRWSPLGDALDVPLSTPIDLTFSDYPDPDTVGGDTLVLTTGVFWHTGRYTVDLLSKRVRFKTPGTLRTDLTYTITVLPNLRSLQGCPTRREQRSFRTAEEGAAPVPTTSPADPSATSFAAGVLPIFAARCGGAGCHRSVPPAPNDAADPAGAASCLSAPAKGLSLCDAHAYDALVGVPSRQVSRFLLVHPSDSSRSYLLRKLISAEPSPGARAEPGDGPRPLPTTLGHSDPPGAPLPGAELRVIADWIDTGALP
jgi:hypothetical protein